MPRKAASVKDTTIYQCWVSGNAYGGGVKEQFDVEPAHTRKTGLGYMVRFDLTRDQARQLEEVMTVLALDISDENPNDTRVESIYRDLGRWPEAIRPR